MDGDRDTTTTPHRDARYFKCRSGINLTVRHLRKDHICNFDTLSDPRLRGGMMGDLGGELDGWIDGYFGVWLTEGRSIFTLHPLLIALYPRGGF